MFTQLAPETKFVFSNIIISCIDLIVTNKPRNFQNSCVIKTSLSDFHKVTVTALRMQFHKLKPRVSFYRDHTKFSNETFINSLKVELDTDFFYKELNFLVRPLVI